MRQRNNIILEYGTYMLAYLVSYIASLAGIYYLSGAILMIEALYLYVHWARQSGNLVELRALFTLAWVGGQGLACLQLSKLQKDWSYITWMCFAAIFLAFGIGYEWGQKYGKVEETELDKNPQQAKKLMICMMALALVSVLCFVLEAVVIGFVPLFSDMPHAYSYFHLSGVHYFTISCILIPAITVLYLKVGCLKLQNGIVLAILNLIAVGIPFLCVSRFQLLFAVGFAVVTYIMVNKKIRIRTMLFLLIAMVPVYVVLTVFRHHDVSYLNSIFEMKYSKMPIFITQPYMYVVNNFENFNCMVEQLVEHTWGVRMLFPFFALTGLKFVWPQVTSSVVYLTKPELTTLTMFYDAYYDFGIVGVFVFAIILGAIARILMSIVKKSMNPISYLFYGQIAIYLGLSFFTTWFSNPTTWFWLILTGMMCWFTGFDKNRKRKKDEEQKKS